MRRALFRVKVSGESMWPEIVSGKTYWASGFLRPRAGDAVVFRLPQHAETAPSGAGRIYVKRVVAEEADGYRVASLVPWGAPGKEFGTIPFERVLGRLI